MLTPWEKSHDTPRQHVKKQRHHSANNGLYRQSYGFSSSHVWMCVKVKVTQLCQTLCNLMDYTVHGILQVRILRGGSLSLLQGIFPIQGSNPGLPHCRQILYQLSYKGSPRILEWVAYHFSSRSPWPRNQTGISCIAGGFFTNWAMHLDYKEGWMPKNWCFQTGTGGVSWESLRHEGDQTSQS